MIIYFMKYRLLRYVLPLFLSLFFMSSCILFNLPDLNEINLSGCMKTCNSDAKKCLDSAEKRLTACPTDAGSSGTKCQLLASSDSKVCLTTCLDCISICTENAEKVLKNE
jgi:hypothetical protein